jgi:predicted nuclease of predicted toxin-antitoxin system
MSLSNKPKFYTDEHVPSAVVEQLQRRGVDIVRCQDVDLRTADDSEHLAYAIEHERILVSRDKDFTVYHASLTGRDQHHYGIVYINRKNWENIGLIVSELLLIHEVATADEMIDQIWYI